MCGETFRRDLRNNYCVGRLAELRFEIGASPPPNNDVMKTFVESRVTVVKKSEFAVHLYG